MCTVSWLQNNAGFQLFCNRDERVSRAAADPPALYLAEGTRYIAPVDPEGGGSWIGVNEYGVAVCLLNGYRKGASVLQGPSRGRLVRGALAKRSAFGSLIWMAEEPLSLYLPFTALALDPYRNAWTLWWNGERKLLTPATDDVLPLTSSAFDDKGGRQFRRKELKRICRQRGGLNAAALLEFHASHGAGPNAYTPCMHRAESSTVSFSRILVCDNFVRFWYHPAALCERVQWHSSSLPRIGCMEGAA